MSHAPPRAANDSLERICHFARDYRAERHRTPRQLYDATGYSASHASLTQEQIEEFVTRDVSLINDWHHFTQDKRWTPAWGLTQRSDNEWVVFHMSRSGRRDYELLFATPVSACALLIRLEMEGFRCADR